MIQGTHRDLWKKVEFPLLFRVVNAVIREDKSYSDAYFDCTNVRIVITKEDLVPSGHECDEVVMYYTPGHFIKKCHWMFSTSLLLPVGSIC